MKVFRLLTLGAGIVAVGWFVVAFMLATQKTNREIELKQRIDAWQETADRHYTNSRNAWFMADIYLKRQNNGETLSAEQRRDRDAFMEMSIKASEQNIACLREQIALQRQTKPFRGARWAGAAACLMGFVAFTVTGVLFWRRA